MFENIKGIIRSRTSKKNRQYDGHKKKRTDNAMATRKKPTDNTMASRKGTDNTMATRKRTHNAMATQKKKTTK
jgi:hypothetical protein